jgi:hypothetical protein
MKTKHWIATVAVLTASAGAAQAANLLVDPGFDTPSGLGSPSFSGLEAGGLSSAAAWDMWNNTMVTTTTSQAPSTDPFGGGEATHVVTAGPEDGLYQFVADNSVDYVSVDVYLLRGSFELGLGQHGYYSATATTSVHDQWVRLSAHYPPLPVTGSPQPGQIGDEIFLYSTDGGGADFYVDNAYAGSSPVTEPAAWAMMLMGLGGMGQALRRRRVALASAQCDQAESA